MYSGLLPSGLTEADLSSDDADEGETAEKTDEHQSHQSGTEPHSASAQVECNNRKSDVHDDALEEDCLPGVSLDMWKKFKDLQRAKHDQSLRPPQIKRQRKRRHKKGGTENCSSEQKREPEEKRKEHWKELTQYFGISDRFKPPSCSKPPLMLAVKIAQAADCRDFSRTKQEAEASRAAQKKEEANRLGDSTCHHL